MRSTAEVHAQKNDACKPNRNLGIEFVRARAKSVATPFLGDSMLSKVALAVFSQNPEDVVVSAEHTVAEL